MQQMEERSKREGDMNVTPEEFLILIQLSFILYSLQRRPSLGNVWDVSVPLPLVAAWAISAAALKWRLVPPK